MAVAATRSRNTKRDLLAAALADAGPGDLEIAVCYLGGGLRQRRTGLGWRGLAELPTAAAEPTLTLTEVDAAFAMMADLSGSGSATRRNALAEDLFRRATEREQAFLRGLVLGDLRQGAMDALVQEGMARAYGVDPAVLRRAAMLLSSTTAGCPSAGDRGRRRVGGGRTDRGHPGPAHAGGERTRSRSRPWTRSALRRTSTSSWTGSGCRCTATARTCGSSPGRWTTSPTGCRRSSSRCGDLPATELVLDGEVLALRADGRPEAFQLVASRTATALGRPRTGPGAAGVLLRPAARRRAHAARRAADERA